MATTRSGLPRRLGPLYLTPSAILSSWIVHLCDCLPGRHLSERYRMARVGFDVFLLGQLARTGAYALRPRRRDRVPPHAAASTAMLCLDAWFDVTTSTRHDLPLSLLLAGLCWWPASRPRT
ncbi:hypothetical protein GQF42_34595 [Streptomyces broussonetiae]|uniref:Uncharacterized protein n=1 Tax=Streptomyces broussonetiae TaxID=2686304 RepID=A0A6I6NAH7_9ACTN|nr:hypothetical protein [Streptomyces broussonetiae]QHA07759.1 hypothetical protein GQF42_34595 [Streptomyces broussonetiae]